MTGLYIFVGLFVVGTLSLIVYKIRSNKAEKTTARLRAEKIEQVIKSEASRKKTAE